MNKKNQQREKKISLKKTQMIKVEGLSKISGGKGGLNGGFQPGDGIDFTGGCKYPEQGSNPNSNIDPTGPSN